MKNFTNLLVTFLMSFAFTFVSAQTYDVTFRVDMKNVDPTTFTTPEVNGTFNGWCGNCNAMSDADGDNIWDITIPLADGTYEFKYSADVWTIQENLTPGDPCVITTGPNTNRTLVVAGSNVDLGTVCWESCDECPNDLILQGVMDFTVPGGGSSGKAIHVKATADIADLSVYGIGVANNGGGTDGQEYTFDAISVLAGDDILLARDVAEMTSYFAGCYSEFEHVLLATTAISQNGDDAIELFHNGNVIETFGDINVDGTGEVWEYMDAWAYKDDAGSVTFDGGNWTVAAINCTDGSTTIFDASCIYPLCPLNQIDLPISWDDPLTDYTVTDFGGNASTVIVDPAGLRGNILQSEKTSGAQTWAGTTLGTGSGFATAIPFVSGATTMTAHVYSPAVGTAIRLKAEDSSDPTKSVETQITSTIANDWEIIVFDFANHVSGTAQIDFSYTYDKLSIFYDFGNGGAGDLFYLDEVLFGGSTSGTPGCTDPLASNYDNSATVDDGSCVYAVTFNVDMNCEPAGSFTTPNLESPVYGWCGGCIALTDVDGDGVWSVTLDLPLGTFEYKYAVDSWAGQEDLVDDMIAGGTCAPVTDYATYANRQVTVVAGLTTADTYGSCDPCVLGCTDPTSLNYDPLATTDDGSCFVPMVDLFFSEYAEGSSNNKYFEIYNPTANTVDLSHYAYPNVSNAPTTPGVHEYWNTFATGAQILPNDVYVVAHGSADASILAEADETFNYLSNGDDGFALVYGIETSYTIMDWLGNWDGDPGAGWDVAGITEATKDHTLVRKCDVTTGNTSWSSSAGTDSLNSEWTVYPQNTWTYVGSHVTPCPGPTSLISDCDEFTAGPTAWPYVLEAVNVSAGAISQGAQTFTMNVTNLPSGGATFRVAKTTANGNWFFGPAQTMVVGSNSITVSSVTFNRTVKFQFSSGDVEFDALTVNGVSTNCLTPPPPPTTSLISDCDEFTSGPTAWPYVLEAVNVSAGVISQGTQTFTMNVTNLPSGGANYRVAKTTANGNWFFGPTQTMVVGSNSTTVSAVTFNRTVKFQFSSGDVEFDILTLNGVASSCVATQGCTDPAADNYDASALVDDGSCVYSYTLNMFDSWGDGWNGNTWTATGTLSGTVYGPYTIATGSSGTETFTSSDLCFTVVCDGGSFQSEVSWDLLDGSSTVILTGGAPYTGSFGACVPGCTDPSFDNYDPTANQDDGSCTNTYTLVMTDSWGDGWNGNEWSATSTSTGAVYGPYTIASGSSATETFTSSDLETLCHLVSCGGGSFMSEVSWDLQDAAGVSILAGGAPYSGTLGTCISGCTDPNATNYDPNADIDDGSCIIANCNNYTLTMIDSWGDGWNGNTFDVFDASGALVSSSTLANGSSGTDVLCLPDACYDITCGGGSFMSEVSWTLTDDATGTVILSGGAPYGPTTLCVPPVYGCTDPTFDNYDATATVDDGSCANSYTLNMFDSWGDGWNGNTWTATGTSSGTIYGPYTIASGSSATETFTSTDLCFTVVCDGGSYQGEVSWDLLDGSSTIILSGGAPYTGYFGTCVLGCTDPNAPNYDPTADVDDGSCSYGPCFATAPTHEDFSAGALPSGYCTPSQWATYATTGGPWVFAGTPGYQAASNGRSVGTYTWIDFSGTDVGVSLEVEDIDVSGLTTGAVFFDYYQDWGTYGPASSPNILNVEVYDSSAAAWTIIGTIQAESAGWETHAFTLPSYTGTIAEIRFTAESGGLSTDFYGDILLDDVKVQDAILGCTDPSFDNYDATANLDDGSCTNSYTLYMYDSYGDGWNGNEWSATGTSTGTVYGPYTLSSGSSGTATFTSSDLETLCHLVVCNNGAWQSEVSWDLQDAAGVSILAGGAPYSGTLGTCTYGCTDPAAFNYDPTADIDDASCTYPCIEADSTESFEASFGMWQQDSGDDFDWTLNSGGTPSSNTGPSAAFDGTYYAYVETSPSSTWNGATANLIVPCVDPTFWVNSTFVFAYHMFGAAMGTMNVDVSEDDGATWTNVWSLSGDQGNAWTEASIDLSSYTGQIDLRIQAVGGSSFTSDMAIDLTRFMELPIPGCTNPNADNYNPSANLEDGSCAYAGCFPLTLNMSDSWGDGWNGNTFTITDSLGWTYFSTTLASGSFGTDSVCLSPNICYIVTCGGGSFASEVSWTLTSDVTGGVVLSGGAPYSAGFCSWPSGCMDPLASNYDTLALVDDGSCLYATTFNVDMNCEPAGSFTSVNLESPLFGWCGGCVPLADPDGDGVWSVTLDLAAGSFEYKYAVDGWTGQEDLVDDMQNGGTCAPVTDYFSYANRLITVAPGYVTNDTYGSCNACVLGCMDPLAGNYDPLATTDDGSCLYAATFDVDMTCVDPSTYTTVHLESPFFGCFTGCTQMTDPDGDKVYSVTVNLPLGANTYLYSVDYNSSQENLIDDMVSGGTCAPITDFFSYANREIVVTTGSNTASDTYGSCDPCIAGCTDSLANNFDPIAEFDDGSYCEYDVTFVVDMSCYAGTFTTLAATGPADNWSGNTYLLTDADGDNVWEGTYSVTNDFVYMYVVDTWADSEFSGLFNEMLNGTNSCAPYTDNLSYAYRMAASPSTTSDTYGQCAPCAQGCTDALASNFDANAQIDDGSCLYATTFNVDMNCEAVGSFTSVNLESPLFGWCGGCVPLTDADGDGVWSVTVDLALGNFEYKYAVDGWTGQENLVDDMQNGASCAPITDYFSYANRLISVTPGTSTSDTYGSCDPCLVVYGCTDAGATNYYAGATNDDGSCLYSTTFNVDMNCEPAGSFGYVHLESPSFGWCGGCVPMADPDGDGVHSVTVDLPAGNFEYKYAVDGWAGQENLIDDMVGGASCAPVTDYFSYANRLLDVNGINTVGANVIQNGTFSQNSNWSVSGGWAIFGGSADLWLQTSPGFSIGSQRIAQSNLVAGKTYQIQFDLNVVSGSIGMTTWGSDIEYFDSTGTYSIIHTASSNNLVFFAGDSICDLNLDNVSAVEVFFSSSPNTDDTYGSCSECILGCTDSLAFNYSDSAMVDDGSCLYGYNCPAPYPIGLSSSDIFAEMATVHWADANGGSCRVWKYFVRYRPVGDSVWTTKAAGVGSGLCNVGLPNTSKVLRNLSPSTTYEFKMKAFYCGGGESNYSYTDQFTTLPACPPMTNLAVQTFSSNHGKAKFTWNETGPYTFARIALRVNTPGSSWQTAGGFGVNYPQFFVLKFGLTGGTEYRAQGRTFCDPVVTSYRSTWTAPIVWTQPGVAPIRLDGGTAINNLEVYPNPSKDIFNVSFVSEDMQNLQVRVLNLIGEVIYTEGLEQFVGEYTKSINLSKYTKGVYFLEITTKEGVVNKKIVLQ